MIFFPHLPQASFQSFISQTVPRLVLAAVLGGLIGLERGFKRRPAGLRTNMFICFGSAMFTILSAELAGAFTGDHTRIAAQIIPGIGFIGAGSILHSQRGGTTGLTTAAVLFVVASVGMACGGGLYIPAIFATLFILLALELLGWSERKLSLKPVMMQYSILTGKSSDEIVAEVNDALDAIQVEMQSMRLNKADGKQKIVFSVDGTNRQHKILTERFRRSEDLHEFEAIPGAEPL